MFFPPQLKCEKRGKSRKCFIVHRLVVIFYLLSPPPSSPTQNRKTFDFRDLGCWTFKNPSYWSNVFYQFKYSTKVLLYHFMNLFISYVSSLVACLKIVIQRKVLSLNLSAFLRFEQKENWLTNNRGESCWWILSQDKKRNTQAGKPDILLSDMCYQCYA